MAFSFGFYNSIDHDRRYNAIQVSKIFDGIINDGVYATVGKAMVLRVNNNGQVLVQPGRAWFDHTWNENDADLLLPTPQSELSLDRYDAVVIDIQNDVKTRRNNIIWVIGEPSLSPKKPAMIKTLDHTQYPLGYVYRKANSTEILQADIENTVGTSECPFVTGIIETINIDELLLQWKDQWAQFVKNYEKTAVDWFLERQKEYIEYFTKLREESDAYHNLYITDIQNYYEEVSSRGEEKYKEFEKRIDDYAEELETTSRATIASIIKQMLDFRDFNEADFLAWVDSVKEALEQYPTGEFLQELLQTRKEHEEILDMLVTGYVITQLWTDEGDFITDDLGNPILTGTRIGSGTSGGTEMDPDSYQGLLSKIEKIERHALLDSSY